MVNWLALTEDQRRHFISELEYTRGLIPNATEKDWWVTLTLKALFHGRYASHIVFKGGTSLSKCWNLISRFSEDIDIALAPEAFGMKYELRPSKRSVKKLKRIGCQFIISELKTDLDPTIAFIPPADMHDAYRKDYAIMRKEMIYEDEPVEYDVLITRLEELQERLRAKVPVSMLTM
jgi:hypothetical protein